MRMTMSFRIGSDIPTHLRTAPLQVRQKPNHADQRHDKQQAKDEWRQYWWKGDLISLLPSLRKRREQAGPSTKACPAGPRLLLDPMPHRFRAGWPLAFRRSLAHLQSIGALEAALKQRRNRRLWKHSPVNRLSYRQNPPVCDSSETPMLVPGYRTEDPSARCRGNQGIRMPSRR